MPVHKSSSLQRFLLEITLVLLLAASTRIINSSHYPVWTDEGWTIWAVQSHDFGTVVDMLARDRHPPAYFLALSAWSSITGDTHIALRYLSIMIGLLTVAVTYRIGRETFGHRAGLYAALLMAVLSAPVYYSQEIRHYGLLALATALMSLFFLRYLRRPTPARLIPYALSIALMLYTQWLGLAILALQIGFGLLIWRGTWRQKINLIGAWAAAALLYLPWIPTAWVQLGANFGGGGFNNSIGHVDFVAIDFFRMLDRMLDGQIALVGGVILLALVTIRKRTHWYIALGGLGLYALFFLVSQKIDILLPRTTLFLVPLMAVLAGAGFYWITSSRLRAVFLTLFVVAVLVRGTIVQGRIDADKIAQEVASKVDSSDMIMLGMDWDSYTMLYELRQAGVTANIFMPHTARAVNGPNQDTVQRDDVRPYFQQYKRIMVLQWIEPPYVIPMLEDPQYGFHKALDFEIPVGRQLRDFISSQNVHTVMYERFDENTVLGQYGDLFALHDANVSTKAYAGETIFVDLWWTATSQPKLDYSAGVYLLDAGGNVVAQSDGPLGDLPTSQWAVDSLQFDRRPLVIPPALPAGNYQIAVGTYWFGDQKPLLVDGQPLKVVGQIDVGTP